MGYPLHGCILGVIVCSPYYIETLKLWRAGHRLDHATRHWTTESNKTETENKDYDACSPFFSLPSLRDPPGYRMHT